MKVSRTREELTKAFRPAEFPRSAKYDVDWTIRHMMGHSPDWWRRNWEGSGVMTVELADMMPDGWKHWMTSDAVSGEWRGEGSHVEMLRVDAGRNLGFTRMVARRKQDPLAHSLSVIKEE